MEYIASESGRADIHASHKSKRARVTIIPLAPTIQPTAPPTVSHLINPITQRVCEDIRPPVNCPWLLLGVPRLSFGPGLVFVFLVPPLTLLDR